MFLPPKITCRALSVIIVKEKDRDNQAVIDAKIKDILFTVVIESTVLIALLTR
jgi:hypothetical protein